MFFETVLIVESFESEFIMLVKIKQNAKDFCGIIEEGGEFGVELCEIDSEKTIIESYSITFFKKEADRDMYFIEIDSDYTDFCKVK